MIYLRVILVLVTLSVAVGCDTKQGVKIGDTPPGFSGTDITGEFVSLSQFKGKVVVLYFWTNSCCGDRLKLLEPFYRENKQRGLAVLAINVGDTKETVESYVKNNTLTFSFQTDEHKMISGHYGVFGFPTIFILDRNGVIREKILGNIPEDKLEKLIQRQFDIQKQVEASYEKNHPR
ncbi:MAG: TlpA family protein disulfide reductase [Geobacter sp.]|nr:MAG: TlpA family protein disulfide reductase [Geobacter sp.]